MLLKGQPCWAIQGLRENIVEDEKISKGCAEFIGDLFFFGLLRWSSGGLQTIKTYLRVAVR